MFDCTYIGGGHRSGRTSKLVALATFYAETNPDSVILFVTHQAAETERILRLLATAAHLTTRIERTIYSGRRSIGYTNGARVKIVSVQEDNHGYRPLIALVDNVDLFPRDLREYWPCALALPADTPVWYTDARGEEI